MSKKNKQQKQRRKQQKQQKQQRKQQKQQRKQQKQQRKQFQGTKEQRAAHFATVDKARKAADALIAGEVRAVKKQYTHIRKVIEAAGGTASLTKRQRAAYEAAGATVARNTARAVKGAETKARKRTEAKAKKEKRSAAARKGWETRREKAAQTRRLRLSELEQQENAKLMASGDGLTASVRGALVQGSLYRKTGVAVPAIATDLMKDLKSNGIIEMDIRDIFGGQTKGGQHVAGAHPDWNASDLEEYWTFDRAREIVDWATAENKIPQLRAFVQSLTKGNKQPLILTREGRAQLLGEEIASKTSNGPAKTVQVYNMPEVVQKSAILSMITRFVAEVYYEDKQKDAANMRRYKSLFGNKSINEAAREKTEQIAEFMRFTDNGTKFVNINAYIDNATNSGKVSIPTEEIKQDKDEIAALVQGIALKGRDTITDTRNGEIFVRILEILGKYGYN